MDSWQAIDRNSRGSLTAVSSLDDTTIVRLVADPDTGALLVATTAVVQAAWFNETPLGTIDGVNTIFTLADAPTTNSLVLTLDRQPQILGVDYTISGNTITYLSAPDISLAGTPHNAIYAISGGIITGTVNVETPNGAINGTNRTYTTLNTITTVIGMQLNGEAIQPAEYTVSGNSFTMETAIPSAFSGDEYTIVYI